MHWMTAPKEPNPDRGWRQRSRQHERIASRYANGDLVAKIAADERVNVKTVRNVARRKGLPRRRPDHTDRNIRIVKRYAAGEPVHAIARDEAVHAGYVRSVAKRAGIPPRKGWQRLYPVEESAFDVPDEIGWWLIGLLAADGCINAEENRVSLSQRADDADVLYAFYDYVGAVGRPLTKIRPRGGWGRGGEYREARIYSQRICAALARHGIVPRKTASLEFSSEAADQAGVWLGLFDGDGSGGMTRNHGRPRIEFYGTRNVIEQCSRFWAKHVTLQTGRAPALIEHRGGLVKMAMYGSNAAIAAQIMLEASPVSLVRKRRVLEQIASIGRVSAWRENREFSQAS